MANGFVNSTDSFQQEEEFMAQEEKPQILNRTAEKKSIVEEKLQVNIFDLLGFIDED